ncbi:MAG: NADH-quinone oxidoreductase [Nitrospinaceae bacterium]|nr:MAG: NADH-quinone oxidoreductase [Nitrospinaceae bacterium]
MADEQITLTIDDQSVTVPKGTKVVDAAKTVGIEIPVFCYHEKIGALGCCRMCLVEVEKMPKLMTACTMDVGPDMVVKTNTDKVEKAQKGVLEFTLLNHPLDCPVCDKGGECPLQNNTFKYGPGDTRMEFYRAHNLKAAPLSPVITLDRERCIACQRCTAYSSVIEQDHALVMHNRGFNNEIGTFNNEPYDTRFSGNVIDICPVGALTNTQFRFKARTWDLTNSDTLCAHCGCNCNMTLGVRTNKFMRIESRPNDWVDDGWICDKARWGYDFLEGKNRLVEAVATMEKGEMTISVLDGGKKTLPIKEAVERTANAIKKIVDEHGPQSVGFIGSPYGTNEELYLYQKLFRTKFGTNNIDHKVYAESPGLPIDHFDLSDIETSNLVLMIASDPTEELPILDLRIKKVVTRKGVKLAVLNDQGTLMDKYAHLSLRYNIGTDAQVFSALAASLSGEGGGDVKDTGIETEQLSSLVEMLKSHEKVTIVYNPAALTGQSVHVLKRLLGAIRKIPDIQCGAIPAAPQTNSIGALDMGILPDYYPGAVPLSDTESIKQKWGEEAPLTPGLSAMNMIQKAASGELKALLIYRANPVVDFPGGKQVEEALKKVDLLVVHDIMETETSKLANVVLPSNGPGYDDGTTTNIGGRVQFRKGGLKTTHPPDWKIISMMAKALGDETDYITSFSVTDEIAENVEGYGEISKKSIKKEGMTRTSAQSGNGASPEVNASQSPKAGSLKLRIANYLFAHDKILDASSTLAHQFESSVVHLHEDDAKKLGLKNDDDVTVISGKAKVEAQVEISNRCNPGGVVLPRISDEQGVLGLVDGANPVTWVEIRKD